MSTFLHEKISGLAVNLKFDNRWPLLFQRIFHRKVPVAVYAKDGMSFITDFEGGDQGGIRHLLTSGMYSRHFGHMGKKQELTVLDLGANGGGFPFCLRDRKFTIKKAVCVEMNPHTYIRLLFNLDLNFPGTAVALNYAVAGKTGWLEIEDSRGSTGQSIYASKTGRPDSLVRVGMITLDQLVKDYFPTETGDLDILKIDIEGAEYEMLLSGNCSEIGRFRQIFIEIHPNPQVAREVLIERIISFGFQLTGPPDASDPDVYFFTRSAPAAGLE